MTITRDIPHKCPVCDAKSKKCSACKWTGVLWGKETMVIEPAAPAYIPSIFPSVWPWPAPIPYLTWSTSELPASTQFFTT